MHTRKATGALTQDEDRLSGGRDPHEKDETVVKPAYRYNGNLYTGWTASLYWDWHFSTYIDHVNM